MVRKQIMIVTKNDWKLLNTNLDKNKQGESIHIPKETPVLPVIFAFLFLDILVFLYIVIVFVYLNQICFCLLSQSALLETCCMFTRLALQIFYNQLSLPPMIFSIFQLQAFPGPFQTKLTLMTKFRPDIKSLIYINRIQPETNRMLLNQKSFRLIKE